MRGLYSWEQLLDLQWNSIIESIIHWQNKANKLSFLQKKGGSPLWGRSFGPWRKRFSVIWALFGILGMSNGVRMRTKKACGKSGICKRYLVCIAIETFLVVRIVLQSWAYVQQPPPPREDFQPLTDEKKKGVCWPLPFTTNLSLSSCKLVILADIVWSTFKPVAGIIMSEPPAESLSRTSLVVASAAGSPCALSSASPVVFSRKSTIPVWTLTSLSEKQILYICDLKKKHWKKTTWKRLTKAIIAPCELVWDSWSWVKWLKKFTPNEHDN